MHWQIRVLHKIIGSYYTDDAATFLKRAISSVINAVHQIFKEDGFIPLETSIGIIQSTLNLVRKNTSLTPAELNHFFIGYALIFSKTASDSGIWNIDFQELLLEPLLLEHSTHTPVSRLNHYEWLAFTQLGFNATVNRRMITKFSKTIAKYADIQDKNALIKELDSFEDRLALARFYARLKRDIKHAPSSQPLFFNKKIQQNTIENTEDTPMVSP